MGVQWLQKDSRSYLLISASQKKPKARLSTVLYIWVRTPFLAGTDLNAIFSLTAAISGNYFRPVCFSSSSRSIFVHRFLGSVQSVSCSIIAMTQEMHVFTVFFIDKPSIAVSIEFLVC